ncbi:MAG: hypothetical protein ACRC8W_19850 [Plesiomonas shigelloides]
MSYQEFGYRLDLLAGGTISQDAANDTDIVNRRTALAILANRTNVKDAAVVATVANVDLATGGLLVVDGYQTVAGDRILVKSQTDPVENGIYVAAAGAWSRSTDADENGEIVTGMQVFVYNDGTHSGHGHIYVMNSLDPVIIGTDPINFVVSMEVAGHAGQLAVDDAAFSVLQGTTGQAAFDSADNALQLIADTVDSVVGAGAGAVDLGTFTGVTIADDSSIKEALQALETKAEADALIYSNNRSEVTGFTNTAGTWTTLTHNLNEDRLSSVSFFDQGNNYQNLNSATLWRPKAGNANAIEVYHSQAKTMTVVCRA